MTFKELIDKARPIPLDEILNIFGVVGVKEGNSVRYKNDLINIIVTGGKWYDNKAGTGSVGPIDLVSHLQGCTFREAVLWIVRSCHPKPSFTPTSSVSTKEEPKALSYEAARARYAARDDSRWAEARSYLVNKRCLNASMIDDLFKNNNIYATNKGGVVFLHRNLNGEEVGCSIRSVEHSSKFHQSLGKKVEGWFFVGDLKNAKIIVIGESAIDVLSLVTLCSPDLKTAVVAVSGAYSPLPLLEHAFKNKAKIIAAYDNDTVGLNAKEHLRVVWSKITGKNGVFEEKISALKDWNDDLCNMLNFKKVKNQPAL